MIEWIVSSSVLIAVVILLRFVLKGKISLRLQYALWALVLVRLLVPVSFGSSDISVMNTALEVPVVQDAVILGGIGEIELSDRGVVTGFQSGAILPDTPVTVAEGKSEADFSRMKTVLNTRDIFIAVWGIGSAIMLLVFAVTNNDFRRRLTQNRKTLPDVQCPLPVYISESVETPCLFGLFRPAIYLTVEAAESEHTRRHAIEHELTHFHHRDNIWAILRSVCLAVHWYNPLVWCAAVLSRNDAELACDEATILRLGEEERASYGRTLIQLTCEKRPALLNTATTMTDSGKSIKERIELIVKKPKMAGYTLAAVILIAVFAVGCTFTGAKKTDAPWNWAQTLSADDITSVILWEDNGNVTLTEEESADLVQILNELDESNFSENTKSTGGTPTYGLTIQTIDGEYHINESIALSGSLELVGYGDKQWWIDDDDLAKFIREIPGNNKVQANIAVALSPDTPQAVIDYAMDFVQQQIDYHNELGKNPPENMGEYTITDAKITALEQISTGTAGLNEGVALYCLEYRLLADHPENIIMAGGMSEESGWLTEYGSAGQPYLLLHYDDSGSEIIWTPICVTNTDVIEGEYGTPELLEKYGSAYTAAAMELWSQHKMAAAGRSMARALQDATMENSSLTRIEENKEVDLIHSGATMDVLKSAAENLQGIEDPVAIETYDSAAYLWLGEPGDRHISFSAGIDPNQVLIRYVGDHINESAVTYNSQLYLFLMAAAEMENVELHDLDGDGFLEGIIWLFSGNRRNIVIYDVFDGTLQRTDVNETMNCAASDFTGLIANIDPEFNHMVRISDDAGQALVYQYNDGTFSYVCPLHDVIG